MKSKEDIKVNIADEWYDFNDVVPEKHNRKKVIRHIDNSRGKVSKKQYRQARQLKRAII